MNRRIFEEEPTPIPICMFMRERDYGISKNLLVDHEHQKTIGRFRHRTARNAMDSVSRIDFIVHIAQIL